MRDFLVVRVQTALERLWGARFAGSTPPAWAVEVLMPAIRQELAQGRSIDSTVEHAIEEILNVMQAYGHELPTEAVLMAR